MSRGLHLEFRNCSKFNKGGMGANPPMKGMNATLVTGTKANFYVVNYAYPRP